MADKSYIGAGKLYMDGRFVGNVSDLTLNFEYETKELIDYTQGGGGTYNSLERISSSGFTFTFHDYSAENLAMALYGTSAAVTAATVTDEAIAAPSDVATNDGLVTTASMIDTSQTVTVTNTAATVTYTQDTDYTVSAAGVVLLAAGAIANDQDLLIDYTKKAHDLVQALTTSGGEYVMVFDGLNDAQSGDEVVVKIYRAKPSPAEGLPLIGDDFAANTVTGKVVKDTTITTTGLSQYFKIAVA